VRPDGSIAATGLFSLPGPFPPWTLQPKVAVFTNAWAPIGEFLGGAGSVHALATLPNGDLAVGGSFQTIDGVPRPGLARWNGATWSNFSPSPTGVGRMVVTPNGDLALVGSLPPPGGALSPNFARLTTTCPASVTSFGSPCTGSAGTLTLGALSLPWLCATFRSRATGLPANALAIEVLGLSSLPVPLPMPAILPQGVAGCTLTTAPDLLNVHLPVHGAVELAMPFPNTMVFAGHAVFQQVAALELGPTLDFLALTGSNSLQIVKGFF
jgi:hypothetical protein